MNKDVNQRRRRAYLLFEMLILIGVLGMFFAVAGKLLTTSLKTMAEAQLRDERARRFDRVIDQLRRDVCTARTIQASGQSATICESDGRTVVWRIEPQDAGEPGTPDIQGPAVRLLRRVAATAPVPADDISQWLPLPAGISFSADGPTLIVRLPKVDDGQTAGGEIAMISEVQMLAESKP